MKTEGLFLNATGFLTAHKRLYTCTEIYTFVSIDARVPCVEQKRLARDACRCRLNVTLTAVNEVCAPPHWALHMLQYVRIRGMGVHSVGCACGSAGEHGDVTPDSILSVVCGSDITTCAGYGSDTSALVQGCAPWLPRIGGTRGRMHIRYGISVPSTLFAHRHIFAQYTFARVVRYISISVD